MRHALRAWHDLQRAAGPCAADGGERSRGAVAAATLVVTFANPSVYLETLVLIGSAAAAHEAVARTWFALGAITASALWFAALGGAARHASRWLARPRAWQWLNGASALSMAGLSVVLVWPKGL